jgi:hypothetical protein
LRGSRWTGEAERADITLKAASEPLDSFEPGIAATRGARARMAENFILGKNGCNFYWEREIEN